MENKLFYICSIVAIGEEDYKIVSEYFINYPVLILRKLPDELYFELPTCLVGWNVTKHKFAGQNIFSKTILHNLMWTFSKFEKESEFIKDLEEFFYESLKQFLPKNFELHDSFLSDCSFQDFFNAKINFTKKLYLYADNGALYIHNDSNNFILNLKSISALDKNFKKNISLLLNNIQAICFSYSNLEDCVDFEILNNLIAIDTLRWVKYGVETSSEFFQIIPNFKLDKQIPFLISKHASLNLDYEEQKFLSRMFEKEKITNWLSSREIAFSLDLDKELNYKIRNNFKLAKINYSNKRTITGRIVAHDVYNPQNLDKSNDDRKKIISRFDGGNILVFDYISFEPKISIYETKNKKYISEYASLDLHKEVAGILFENDNVADWQRSFAKSITNPLLYGEGEASILNKLSVFDEPAYKLHQVKVFLKPILELSKEINKTCKNYGYVITPQGSIVKPKKHHAGFNNYIQAYASEIVIDKIIELKEALNPRKTQFIFQVHDSLVFDLHPDEHFLIKHINEILSEYKCYDMKFSLSISLGLNYKDLKPVSHCA